MTSIPPSTARVAVRSPADLIAAVPYLIGFHPDDSLVVVALRRGQITFVARGDLPEPRELPGADLAGHVAATVARQRADTALLVGYGPARRVDPFLALVRRALARRGIDAPHALRVDGGRFWQEEPCADPACCPAEGTPYDIGSSAVAAAAIYAGHVALPDRDTLVAGLAAVDGDARAAMRRATARAQERLAGLLRHAPATEPLGGRTVRAAGEAAVEAAFADARRAAVLGDQEAAWLTLLLGHLPVRDHAWRRVTADEWHLCLWSDLTRRAEPGLVAAPASLLAFAAWRLGRGAVARVALDRALEDTPRYGLAAILREALDHGLPPDVLTGGVTPRCRPGPG